MFVARSLRAKQIEQVGKKKKKKYELLPCVINICYISCDDPPPKQLIQLGHLPPLLLMARVK